MERVNPLNQLISKLQAANYKEDNAKRWQHSRVHWTVQQLALQKERKQFERQNGNELLTFEWLNGLGCLPVYLSYVHDLGKQPLHKQPKAVQPNWFKAFPSLPFISHYVELVKSIPVNIDKPIGLIFPRKGFGQGLILHNGDLEDYVPFDTGCHVYRMKENSNNDFLIVQSYSSFVESLKSGI